MGVLVNNNSEGDVVTKTPRRRLRHCCCGCSLQAGCIVIGTLGLMNGIGTLYVSLYTLSHVGYHSGYGGNNFVTEVMMIFFGALHVATGLSLIYGADKRRPSLLKFWLLTRYIEFVLIVGASLYFLILILSNAAPAVPVLLTICSFAFAIGILAYCISTVHSFCQEITDSILPLKEEI